MFGPSICGGVSPSPNCLCLSLQAKGTESQITLLSTALPLQLLTPAQDTECDNSSEVPKHTHLVHLCLGGTALHNYRDVRKGNRKNNLPQPEQSNKRISVSPQGRYKDLEEFRHSARARVGGMLYGKSGKSCSRGQAGGWPCPECTYGLCLPTLPLPGAGPAPQAVDPSPGSSPCPA